ncbi:cytochrome P450 [Pseudofrankia inefficax]|uniref:Cytochrome P450 n=1 Tax=Pseudofrankia inefficax (strain DSM 45817 / CECT 9037 / DDB 130130 / EuI1c) TaxID=298654 RepID=E3JBU6_PSEI1|nr:cytochrome P450 [Pseudofrankia inefficax]ADP82256.1 cytochrome P450 [Pseudofrankia inefficax]
MALLTKDEMFAQYDWARPLREKDAFHRGEDGVLRALRFAETRQILLDHEHFSNSPDGETGNDTGTPLPYSDPPRHRHLRSLAATAFTRQRIVEMEVKVVEMMTKLLDKVADQGEMDVVADLASPLPTLVIADLLNIEPDRRDDFRRWTDAAFIIAGPMAGKDMDEIPEETFQAFGALYTFFDEIAEDRRRNPGDDLVTALTVAEINGERLAGQEVLDFCAMLLMAGSLSTAHLLANMMLCVVHHPGVLDTVRARPQVVPTLVEEVLRYFSPAPNSTPRIAKVRTTVAGQVIEAGEKVIPVVGSAHRDERVFADPDRFDIERDPNPHMGFGQGIHFCLGAPLARMEASLMLTMTAERFPGAWTIPDMKFEVNPSPSFWAPPVLPMTFSQ